MRQNFSPYRIVEKINEYKYYLEEFREGKAGSFLMCSWNGTMQNSFKPLTVLIVPWVKLKPIAVLQSISESSERQQTREESTQQGL